MRIGGLASGIDTESIIKDLMKAQRIPLDKVTQKKQYFEWQLNDYRSANRDLKGFSDKVFDNVILSKNFNQKNVAISAPDDISIKSKGNTEDFNGTIKVKELATNATMQSGKIANHETFKVENESTITIETSTGKKDVKLEVGDDIKAIVKKITEDTGVRAFYDSVSGKIGMSAKDSGEGNIQITHKSGTDIRESLGLIAPADNPTVETSPTFVKGNNSVIEYNGMEIVRNFNTFELDGMEITLKAANNKDITFNATTDTDKVFDTVKGFVDDYNKLIEDLNKKIREPKYRNFQPLSAEQKADMKEKEIELWEEKAMSGTLRNDPELSSLLTTMRTALSGSVDLGNGEKISLSSIGITTSKNYLDHGKLVIDETKLKEAISKNPADVHKLFSHEDKANPESNGVARKLRDAVNATQTSIQKSAGKIGDSNKAFSLGRTLDAMNKQIENFESRMQMVESRYWKQFNAMENAIQRANAQSASLMSALGGGA
ncbi:flagellar hook-associated protein 2 [Sporosarcina gallistercoris]|uniref:Flagellar hook-associated protein 2 n=1 Tax=Sporosarcina gallistercoris TaxID=2762245 RepID=A0ABR8PND6_9BACL|nr:flagellar hook-associated protein 2 [Sporosarcina gallistercoris]MBD7909625.1 flagellar hook-associated protein 2 [Sporosarcina gallistercoris]